MNDKLKHIIAGAVIALIVLIFGKLCKEDFYLPALVTVVLIAAMKEHIYDKWMKRGTPEWLDFIFTLWGGGMVILIWIFISAI